MLKKALLILPFLLLSHFYVLAQDMRQQAQQFVEKSLSTLKLEKSDIQDMVVSDSYTSLGITHLYFQQQYSGIKVFNALLNVAITDNGRVVLAGNRFVPQIATKILPTTNLISPENAVEKAAQHLGLTVSTPVFVKSQSQSSYNKTMAQEVVMNNGGISREDIPAKLVWVLKEDGKLQLCWNLVIYERNKSDWWEIRVSTETGEVLEKNNWVNHCNFNHAHKESCFEAKTSFSPIIPKTDKVEGTLATNDYNVFDLPLESPNFGSRTVVNSPWNKAGAGNAAVALKWHNDGTTTYTSTRGNNVWAKDDIAGDNETTIGASATSATSDFNFPFTAGTAPSTYKDAAITNLFYWNNIVHDVLYQYGFDEPSGNFQNNNQGKGGGAGDYVYADAQDGSGTDNANFATPPDGQKPRMQMFLWSAGGGSINLVVNSPTGIAGAYTAGSAAFNPATPPSTTGNLVITSPAKGCSAITNGAQVSGKIAVIDRGGCTFVTKVKNAQNAGAIGVIIVDTTNSATPPTMGGTDPTINILSCSITKANGTTFKNTMQTGTVNATINSTSGGVQLDGDLDNGVIAHEYGHGVSNRLTGGPSNTSCLANAEQMGEGWSDYIALMLTTNWATAQANDVRGIGTYVIGQPATGVGIREYPYSYDMTVSLYNYDYARANPEVHALGSAWTAMLWDMTWNIINMTPASTNIYSGTGGNNIALRLVMEGMKLQPCSPGFVDGRDAILLADDMLYGSAHRCAIWAAFARRGLGYSASQGSSNSATDGSQAFNVPQGVTLTLTSNPTQASQNGGVTYTLKTQCECGQNNNLLLTATLPTQLDYVSSTGGTYNATTRVVSFPTFNLASGQAATNTIQTTVNNTFSMPVAYFNDDVENGGSKWTAVHLSGTTVNFAIGTANPNSPTHDWEIADAVTPSDNTLRLVTPTLVNPNSALSFWHYHKAETNYDGGVVEISIDNGNTWQDLGNKMTQNGYNGTIDPVTDNVLINRQAFTGEVAMRRTVADLSSYAGQYILIRFRFATDTQNGTMTDATGWFVDDIQFVSNDTCLLVTGQVGNGTISDNASICTSLTAGYPTGISETAINQPIKVYPNPTKGQLTIELPENLENGKIIVMNMLGQEVKNIAITEKKMQVIEIGDLPNAPYLIGVQNGEHTTFTKVTKQD
jgi:hypothetical protein